MCSLYDVNYYLYIFFSRLIVGVLKLERKELTWANTIPFILPGWIWATSGLSLGCTLLVWLVVILISSFIVMVFGLTAGHHSHTNFFEGDVPRYIFLFNFSHIIG